MVGVDTKRGMNPEWQGDMVDLIGTKARDMTRSAEAFHRRPDSLLFPGRRRLTYYLPDDTHLISRVPRPKATTGKAYKRSSSSSAMTLPSSFPEGMSTSLLHRGQPPPCFLTMSRESTPYPETHLGDSNKRGKEKNESVKA